MKGEIGRGFLSSNYWTALARRAVAAPWIVEYLCAYSSALCFSHSPDSVRIEDGCKSRFTFNVAVQSPDLAKVKVCGARGVGPVGSPDEQVEVGSPQTYLRQKRCRAVSVAVAVGVAQNSRLVWLEKVGCGGMPPLVMGGKIFGEARMLFGDQWMLAREQKRVGTTCQMEEHLFRKRSV